MAHLTNNLSDFTDSVKKHLLSYKSSLKNMILGLEQSIEQSIEVFAEKTLPEFFTISRWSHNTVQLISDLYAGFLSLYSTHKKLKLVSETFDYKDLKVNLICVPLNSSLEISWLHDLIKQELISNKSIARENDLQDCLFFAENFRCTELHIARQHSLKSLLSSEIGGHFQEDLLYNWFRHPYYPLESENRKKLIEQSNAYVQYAFIVWGYLGFYLTVFTSAMDGINHIVQKKAPFVIKFAFGMARKGLDSIPSGHDIQSFLENVFKIHPRLENFVPQNFLSTVRFFIERSKNLSSPWGVASNSVAQWISIFELFFQKTGDYFASWVSLYKNGMTKLGQLAILSPALAAMITIALQISSLFILSNLCLYALSIAPPAVIYIASVAAMGISAIFATHLLYKGLHRVYDYFYPNDCGQQWTQEVVDALAFNADLKEEQEKGHADDISPDDFTVSVPLPQPRFTDYAQDSYLTEQLDTICQIKNDIQAVQPESSIFSNHYSLYQYACKNLFIAIQNIFQLQDLADLTILERNSELREKLSDLNKRSYKPDVKKNALTNRLEAIAFKVRVFFEKMKIYLLQSYFDSYFFGENFRLLSSSSVLRVFQNRVKQSVIPKNNRVLIFVSPENRISYERAITNAHQDYLKGQNIANWLHDKRRKNP